MIRLSLLSKKNIEMVYLSMQKLLKILTYNSVVNVTSTTTFISRKGSYKNRPGVVY